MQYILLQIDGGDHAYQEVFNGIVQRICTLDGNTIDHVGQSKVIDANPVPPVWALPDPTPDVMGIATPQRVISKVSYMRRFTDAELATIFTVAKSEVMVEVWLEKFKVAEYIDMDDPETQGGLNALEQFGLIGAGRASEIINA